MTTATLDISPATRDLYRRSLVWDAHSCLPLAPDVDVGVLDRHRRAGIDYVSINVGMDFNPVRQCIRVLAAFRDWILRHPQDYALVGTVAELEAARAAEQLAVSFDLEGTDMLEGDLAMLRLYRDLGVRQLHVAYNRDNAVGGGCHGADVPLTDFGRQVVAAVNALGIIMDCSHTGHRTSLDIMAASTKPVVFSHTCVHALQAHPRNVRDDQIDACAATGGVVGITGVGLFLGDPEAGSAAMVRHLDYIAQRVGPGHVGIGLDFNFIDRWPDRPDGFVAADWWPPGQGYGSGLRFARPEQFAEIADGLAGLGWSEDAIVGALGGNFLRVARATWPG